MLLKLRILVHLCVTADSTLQYEWLSYCLDCFLIRFNSSGVFKQTIYSMNLEPCNRHVSSVITSVRAFKQGNESASTEACFNKL